MSPDKAIYPKNHIKRIIKILLDGTTSDEEEEFSIAKLELNDGKEVIGIRHDRNVWNENSEEKGYPLVRGQYPAWFIMPDMNILLPKLNELFGNKKEG